MGGASIPGRCCALPWAIIMSSLQDLALRVETDGAVLVEGEQHAIGLHGDLSPITIAISCVGNQSVSVGLMIPDIITPFASWAV